VLSPYEVLDIFLHGVQRTGRERRVGALSSEEVAESPEP
jgi:hypothetical protein